MSNKYTPRHRELTATYEAHKRKVLERRRAKNKAAAKMRQRQRAAT